MALLEPLSLECASHSDEQTQRLGMRLGALLPLRSVVALHGPLGAGKTSFARGIGTGWGADQLLRSPTFTLVQEHHRARNGDGDGDGDRATLYHVDLYRVQAETDLDSLGLDEMLDDEGGVVIIEWAERAPDAIPKRAIHVKIAFVNDTKRQLTISTQDTSTWQVLLAFRKSAFGV
jgi:tRNA threonylcarbamoyladenosine biosynthesis protein TsaE